MSTWVSSPKKAPASHQKTMFSVHFLKDLWGLQGAFLADQPKWKISKIQQLAQAPTIPICFQHLPCSRCRSSCSVQCNVRGAMELLLHRGRSGWLVNYKQITYRIDVYHDNFLTKCRIFQYMYYIL